MIRLATVLLAATVLAGAALAATGDPIERHTAADMARAKAASLRAADLGAGWKAVRVTPEDDCTAFRPDESDLVETGSAERVFEAGTGRVGSATVVFRTEAQARTSWRRVVKPGLLRCALEGMRKTLPAGTRVSVIRLGARPVARLAPRTASLGLIARVQGLGVGTVDVHLDAIAVGRSRTNVLLLAANIGAPIPGSFERSLATVLARRIN